MPITKHEINTNVLVQKLKDGEVSMRCLGSNFEYLNKPIKYCFSWISIFSPVWIALIYFSTKNIRYFIVKSCNRENLELSVQQGVWATQRSNESKLNEAFDSVENVILVFSVNRTRHFQVCFVSSPPLG